MPVAVWLLLFLRLDGVERESRLQFALDHIDRTDEHVIDN